MTQSENENDHFDLDHFDHIFGKSIYNACGIWSATNLDEIVGRYGGLNVEEVGAQADKQFIELILILIKNYKQNLKDDVCRASVMPPLCLRCKSVPGPLLLRFKSASSPFLRMGKKWDLQGIW